MALEYVEINQILVTASSIIGADIFEMEHAGESQQVSASVLADYIAIASVVTAMVAAAVLAANPVGSGLEWYASTAPTGYLLQQGQAVYRSTYSALFAVIGTTWGVGDGSNTFNLPDKREVVGVGIGTNATIVVSAHDVYVLAGFKDDQVQDHDHTIWRSIDTSAGANSGSIPNTSGGSNTGTKGMINNVAGDAGIIRKGVVTRGKRIGVNWIIKYQ
jgi:microcystin-dependent protein